MRRQHHGAFHRAHGLPRHYLRRPVERRNLPPFQFAFREIQQNDTGSTPLVVVDLMDRQSGATVNQFSFSLDAEAFGVAKSIILGRFLPRTQVVYIEAARQIRQILRRVRHALHCGPRAGTVQTRPHEQRSHGPSADHNAAHGSDAGGDITDTDASEDSDFSEEDESSDAHSAQDEPEYSQDEEPNQDEAANGPEMSSGTDDSCTADPCTPTAEKDGAPQHRQGKRVRRSPPVSHSGDSSLPDTSDHALSDDTDMSESGSREEQAPPSDPRPLSPATRQFSQISEDRLEHLDRLVERFKSIEQRCKAPLDWVWENVVPSGDTAEETRNKAIGELSQCYGDLERLQYKAVDAIVTGDLSSGRSEARSRRKSLTQKITRLMNITEETVNRLRKKAASA